MNWIEIKSVEDLNLLKNESSKAKVLLFKYSEECTINMLMKMMLERNWNNAEMENIKTYILNIPAHRDISDLTAADFGVEHESPQVLIISNGKSIYNASHGNVRYDELKKVLLDNKL